MWVLEGSVIYGILKKLFSYYGHSGTRKFFAAFAMCCRNSRTAGFFRAVGRCRYFYRYSFIARSAAFIRKGFNRLYSWLDRLVLGMSGLLCKWSDGSLLCGLFRFVARASKERIFPLAAPVFGMGYFVGRLLFNRLRIRDMVFLSLMFSAAAVLFADREKLKKYFRESWFYKLYLLVLE